MCIRSTHTLQSPNFHWWCIDMVTLVWLLFPVYTLFRDISPSYQNPGENKSSLSWKICCFCYIFDEESQVLIIVYYYYGRPFNSRNILDSVSLKACSFLSKCRNEELTSFISIKFCVVGFRVVSFKAGQELWAAGWYQVEKM